MPEVMNSCSDATGFISVEIGDMKNSHATYSLSACAGRADSSR